MSRATPAVLALALSLPTVGASAERRVQLAPFAGLQFGGAVQGIQGGEFSMGPSLDYGATLDVPVGDAWNIEVLYSRDESSLDGPGPSVDLRVERFMAGLVEEHDYGRTRFFGVGLLGATRWVSPAGYGSATLFTMALGLGVKHQLSERFGVRAEARGFYAVTNSQSALFCRGGCLFLYRSSGLVQGDLTAGVILSF
jgi:hypothetical protein